MAKCIAEAIGSDKTREKEVHRLGSVSAWTRAATWKTSVTVLVNANGSGYVTVEQNGDTILRFTIPIENLVSRASA